MPRRARSSTRPRREQILDEATSLFAERGYQGASMGDLAERVGMRKASLFYHFASKEVLYAQVLARLVDAVVAVVTQAAAGEGSFAERLDAVSDAVTGALDDPRHNAGLLLREAMDRRCAESAPVWEAVEASLRRAETFLRAGQVEGAFAGGDAGHLMMALVGLFLVPFGMRGVLEKSAAKEGVDEEVARSRRAAIREQVRALVLARGR